MRFVLEIDEFDNAALAGNPAKEVARILRAIPRHKVAEAYADRNKYGGDDNRLRDVNGNTVGRYAFTEEDER